MNTAHHNARDTLANLAHQAMADRGLQPDFPPQALAQAQAAHIPAAGPDIKDLTALPWLSIDNDDSRDLDQLSAAQDLGGGATRMLIAIADVDALVPKGSPIDQHARFNTTSVYTAGGIFAMLPQRLSFDLTSLIQDAPRLALVVDMSVAADGAITATDIYRATVTNKAKLAYDSVSAWLDHGARAPQPLIAAGLEDQLRLQDRVADALGRQRHQLGALRLETLRTSAVFDGDTLSDLVPDHKNRAQELIENLMVSANSTAAIWLKAKGSPVIRRVLRTPEHWDRIVSVAREAGGNLPPQPSPAALNAFLAARREADPARFPDLSLSIVKLLGHGDYAVDMPGQPDKPDEGHFGLAIDSYMHSTAPNRRYPDLVAQRLIKAVLAGAPPPYSIAELQDVAQHCVTQEGNANKVERQVGKSAAAVLLAGRLGDIFEGIITGVSAKGTWVRTLSPPVEGMVVQGFQGLQVGQRVRVRLARTDIARGFIDFTRQG